MVEGHRLLAEPQQQLARRVGVVQGTVGSGLDEPHLGREQREAVTSGSRQQDPGDVQGVEDLLGFVPQAGRFQELDVEPGAVADRLASAEEVGKPAEGIVRVGRAA